MDFHIPFPEEFDHLLSPRSRLRFDDGDVGDVDSVIWPEAKSAAFLSQVLRQMGQQTPPAVDPHELSDSIERHTLRVMSTAWEYGPRCAAVAFAFM